MRARLAPAGVGVRRDRWVKLVGWLRPATTLACPGARPVPKLAKPAAVDCPCRISGLAAVVVDACKQFGKLASLPLGSLGGPFGALSAHLGIGISAWLGDALIPATARLPLARQAAAPRTS